MSGIEIYDAYSVVGAFITASFLALFGAFAVYGEVSLRYYQIKNRLANKNDGGHGQGCRV